MGTGDGQQSSDAGAEVQPEGVSHPGGRQYRVHGSVGQKGRQGVETFVRWDVTHSKRLAGRPGDEARAGEELRQGCLALADAVEQFVVIGQRAAHPRDALGADRSSDWLRSRRSIASMRNEAPEARVVHAARSAKGTRLGPA